MTDARPEEETLELFTFSVGPHRYAVDLSRVDEVLPPMEVTANGVLHPPVVGAVLLRGERVPVVALSKCLPAGPPPAGGRPGLLVCWLGRRRVAFSVDAVGAVSRVAAATMQAPAGQAPRAVVAVWAQPPDAHFLLDLRELLRGESPPVPVGG